MRPEGLTGSEFQVNGLANSFTYTPADGPLVGWTISGRYDMIGARLVITELQVAPSTDEVPENGITGTLLRSVRPAHLTDKIQISEKGWLEWLEKGQADAAQSKAGHDLGRVRQLIGEARDLATAPRSGPSGLSGRPPLDGDFLRDVGEQHLREVNNGGTYGAIPRLADVYGVSPNTAKSWVKKARERGFYPDSNDPAETERE